ncbi:MAG: response regulator [Anaerolineae bacterium]|nr:response regulator [Anaerolineae bacterium]MDW8102510.1 response regulator [Anaerolineae bacterium]
MAKILVIEDEKDILELVEISLQLGGFEVAKAIDGLEGLEKAISEKPDLILLDIKLPKLSGYDVCKKLKEIPITKDIPVVFLTARGQDHEIKAGFESGGDDYIVKPFAPDELPRRVREILSRFKR